MPHNIPASLTSFVGRRQELRTLRRLVTAGRLVTISGAGGIGKTRLALELARGLVGRFPGGVWVVDLASVGEPPLVRHAVAAALGVSEQQGQSLVEALADRRLLLVLDNCEHLVAACAELAEVLLQHCPAVHILTTSREILGLTGELTWRIPPLSLPGPGRISSLEQLGRSEATAFFVARARHAVADFAPTPATAAVVAEICRRLDGLPLAVEIAAALMRTLSPEQLAARLDDRFRVLVNGQPSPSHHQTLQATIGWSYGLLSEPQRWLFNRLSVFAGGWTLEAAEAVCAGDGILAVEVVQLLDGLATKSLVVVEHGPSGTVRYRLLETLRAFAHHQLEETGELGKLRERHRAWMLEFSEQAETHFLDDSQGVWLESLEREHDNLRAALRWTLEGCDSSAALRLAGALWRFWYIRGHFIEGRGWLNQLLSLGDPAERRADRALVLCGAAILASEQLDLAIAWGLADEALAIASEVGNTRWASTARMVFGNVARARGDLAGARGHYEAALAMRRKAPHPGDVAVCLGTLGHVALAESDYPRARALYTEALTIERELGQRKDMANILSRLGETALEEGCYDEARRHFVESMAVAVEVGDRQRIAYVLEGFAALAVVDGAGERAERLVSAAAEVRESIGGPLPTPERERLERRMAGCAWRSGASAALGLEEAIALALNAPAALNRARPSRPGRLSPREIDVARLVALGTTNRQIAERLSLAQGTAQRHVANILSKLDLSTRAQIASWAVAHGLLGPDELRRDQLSAS